MQGLPVEQDKSDSGSDESEEDEAQLEIRALQAKQREFRVDTGDSSDDEKKNYYKPEIEQMPKMDNSQANKVTKAMVQ